MEWVETTGKTVEDATARAVAELGVEIDDAEVHVVEEAKPGLFGRVRSEARVRARVRPTRPHPRDERRERRRRKPRVVDKASEPAETALVPGRRDRAESERARRDEPTTSNEEGTMDEVEALIDGEGEPGLAEQGAIAKEFLEGLLDVLGVGADVVVHLLDLETVEVTVTGEQLGFLVGQRGATLAALQDLTRTVVQRRTGAHQGRLLLDVDGYRARRRVALEGFTRRVAAEVLETGRERALEPMAANDRKIVHDTVNSIPGVSSRSVGEDPRRYVVLAPTPSE